MKKRIQYHGGADQRDRMTADKLRSLQQAIMYSYQSEIVALKNGDFRCLINPNKLTMEADDKVISIPFEAAPIGNTQLLSIELATGDVIEWKESKNRPATHWILYQRYLQEDAYYRFAMRQCDAEIELENGTKFWAYVKGPDEKGIDWIKSKHFIFNDLNYTLEIYISKTTETLELFQRFKKLKMYDRNWEVQAKDDITIDGIIVAYLKEDYTNEWVAQKSSELPEISTFARTRDISPRILGEIEIYPYDIKTYTIQNAIGGKWFVSNGRAKILEQNDNSVTIEVTTGKSGSFSLIYRIDDTEDIIQNISILSL